MTPLTAFKDRRVALFGLGGSGLASARALVAGGARLAAWDDSAPARAKAAAETIPLVDLHDADWGSFESLVLAPGVPLTHPRPHWVVDMARAAGVEIIGDIELFCRQRRAVAPGAPFVAITGTNGKSTTTALAAHLFASFGHEVFVGGNIGTPILALAPPAPRRVHVIECSSFQIDLAPTLDPSVGILLNVTPDHLDRHGTMAAYAAIKERLVAKADLAVVCLDDEITRAVADRLRAAGRRLTAVSITDATLSDGIVLEDTRLVRRLGGRARPIADLAGISSLRGRHNGQNAAAAVAALAAENEDTVRVQKALASFPGLAHRLEEVGREGKVLFVNDSKATNADAAEKALLSFDRIYWILGGRSKAGGIEPLKPLFGRVVKAYLVGEATDEFAATLEGLVAFARCGTIERALAAAAADAHASPDADPVVLLSPACASFDQFPDFEKRGDHFRAIVQAHLDRAVVAFKEA
jgi:UDP-N-acetylmuramoylalanine--D-glutamate ligase